MGLASSAPRFPMNLFAVVVPQLEHDIGSEAGLDEAEDELDGLELVGFDEDDEESGDSGCLGLAR